MVGYIAFGVAAYGALVGGLYLAQRQLMYFPFPSGGVREPAAHGAPEMTLVRLISADGLRLMAWYRPPPAPERPVLVYFHGNAGHIGFRAGKVRAYLDAGFGLLLVSYRGYSGNPGQPSEEGLYADGRGALDFLAARGIAPDRMVLYGESLGGGVAIEMARERQVGAVVLEAPFSSIADIAAFRLPFVPVRALLRDRFENAAKIASVGAPVLVVHGEKDGIVPIRFGRKLLAAAAEPKEGRFFPRAGHNDLYDFGAAEAVIDFITRHLPQR
jgi:fermentation-respiration switch protein FrsA (DUF1100 family)